jgi:hypothetical protein
MTAVLLDRQRRRDDVDLLDHPWRDGQRGPQVLAAGGAGVEAMIEGPAVDRLGRERGALVLGMAGLPTNSAAVLSLRWWMSDEGGLEEVEESLRAPASC